MAVPSKKGPPRKKGTAKSPMGKSKMPKGGMHMRGGAGGGSKNPKGRYSGGKSTVKVPC